MGKVKKQNGAGGVLGHVFTVGSFTVLSRVLGLVREMMQSRLIGAGVEQSAFTLAFAAPNMARKIFGEGALTAAFVPVFKGAVERGDEETAKKLVRAVMTTLFLVLGACAVAAVAILSAYLLLPSACASHSPRAVLTVKLVRVLAPYMVFICGAAFGMGVLNALGRFVEGAVMPAFLNIVWIAVLAVLSFFPDVPVETRVFAVATAILAGGFAQMLFLMRCMRKLGYGFRPLSFRRLADGAERDGCRRIWRNTLTAAAGAGAVHVNCMLDQVLAQLAAPWAAGVIGYAERLMDLPLGVVGVAFGTVLLPTFSGLFAKGDVEGARQALAGSTRSLLFVMLPAGAAMCVISPEIVSAIYEGRAFDATATVRVARALAIYALGLGFFGFQKSIVPWFHAQGDMKTPLVVSVRMVFLNAALNVLAVAFLPVEWRHAGLAASTVVCSAAGAALLFVLARGKNGRLGLSGTVRPVLRIVAGSAAMAAALAAIRPHLARLPSVAALSILVAAGFAVYAGFAAVFMRGELRAFRGALSRKRRR